MNDVAVGSAAVDPTAVDASNPWLGLASFTEETRAYFYGRDDEVAELARRVQRKLLTVLFGQSGLGKTSILRAGLVPKLRSQGYCPIYVRIDYGRDTPAPAEQIKRAIVQAARRSGEWTQVGVAVEGESLWEFLHHRDDVLRDESGTTLIPLLIFDQFEEVFTLAQSDDFGRARAARFIAELADLVENRAPRALEAKFEEDEGAAARFDFARSDYRVLIALREDYLASLESLKKAMPSVSQNRLRLARMTGEQALKAVLEPGRKLVSEEVAAAIVRFVAGGSELANAEVEPSLLSLICRELNDARIAQGRTEISLDLLAGSHATILSNFYERALADQPPQARRIIEDDLLTSSGFRENVAEERLVKRFTEAGAAPNTLATLVNRRLLRIEERLDVRRVELTHDVLCAVVKASRDKRQEREAREATERLLAEQRARELAARRAAVRARGIAGACAVLAALAVAAAVYGYLSSQRAQRAERAAQRSQALADQARGQAEHLLGYLTDDFGRELESFGRLDVLKELSQRQIDYFHGLPPELQGPETVRNGAMALIHHGRAMRYLGDVDTAGANAAEALKLLTGLQQQGDHSDATAIALSLAYLLQSRVMDNRGEAGAFAATKQATDLLKPLAEASGASVAVRRAYAEALFEYGIQYNRLQKLDESARIEQQAGELAAGLGGRDLSSVRMAAYYAEALAWETNALQRLGRLSEARRVGDQAVAVADKILEQRPGHRLALHAEQLAESDLAAVAEQELNPAGSVGASERAEAISATLMKLDPSNNVTVNNLAVARLGTGFALWDRGHLSEAVTSMNRAAAGFARASQASATGSTSISGSMAVSHAFAMATAAFFGARSGDYAGVTATVKAAGPLLATLRAHEAPDSWAVSANETMVGFAEGCAAYQRGELADARRRLQEALARLHAMKVQAGEAEFQHKILVAVTAHMLARTEYLLGDYAAAERLEQEAIAKRREWGADTLGDKRNLAEMSTWLALAQARQRHAADAAATIAPVVKMYRGLAPRNHGDVWLPQEFASALYAQALADPKQRAALLKESAALLAGLAPALRPLPEVRQLRDWIREAQRSAG
jgi:hypothetical protein